MEFVDKVAKCMELFNSLSVEFSTPLIDEYERKYFGGFKAERALDLLCLKSERKPYPVSKLIDFLPEEISIETQIRALDKILRFLDFEKEDTVIIWNGKILENLEFVVAIAYVIALQNLRYGLDSALNVLCCAIPTVVW